MQRDDRRAAGALVEPVDVLRDDAHLAVRLEGGQQAVALVRLGVAHPRPALVGPGPVAAAVVDRADELGVEHRRRPHRRRPAVVGDAAVGARARARQDGPGAAGEQVGDRLDPGPGRGPDVSHGHAARVPARRSPERSSDRPRRRLAA